MNDRDIRIETFTGGLRSPVYLRVTHLPTGISVEAMGFLRMKIRNEAIAKLRELVASRMAQ